MNFTYHVVFFGKSFFVREHFVYFNVIPVFGFSKLFHAVVVVNVLVASRFKGTYSGRVSGYLAERPLLCLDPVEDLNDVDDHHLIEHYFLVDLLLLLLGLDHVGGNPGHSVYQFLNRSLLLGSELEVVI